jgi:hypothetical protein
MDPVSLSYLVSQMSKSKHRYKPIFGQERILIFNFALTKALVLVLDKIMGFS